MDSLCALAARNMDRPPRGPHHREYRWYQRPQHPITGWHSWLLELMRRRERVTFTGMQGVVSGKAAHSVSLFLSSPREPSVRVALPRVLVLPRLTALLPGRRVPQSEWHHLRDLELADPAFHRPAAVEAVLGADVYAVINR